MQDCPPYLFGLHTACRWVLLVSLMISVGGRAAQAQEQSDVTEALSPAGAAPSLPPVNEQTKAWEQGVSETARKIAFDLFQRGNTLFSKSEYHQAAEQYRQALAVWDHPRVHGNLATALIHLDDSLEAMKHLEQALAYGAAPFEAHVFEQLRTNHKLLLGQLVRIEVSSKQPGVVVIVDGSERFVSPGSVSILTKAGSHQVVGRKEGHQSFTRELTAIGGRTETIDVKLSPLARVTNYQRNWAAWKPWSVVGTGALIGALGVPLRRTSLSARDQYQAEIDANCPCPTGEKQSPAVEALKGRSTLYNRLEIGAYVLGGATLATGAVLAYLNREYAVESQEQTSFVAVPVVTSEHWGLALEMPF